MTDSENALVRTMIIESGEMWLQSMDRSSIGDAVVICTDPECAFYLQPADNYTGNPANINGWIVEERPLCMSDAADFFAAFGDHWHYWIGALLAVRDGVNLRAFIKNGRQQGWSISVGPLPTGAAAHLSTAG